MLVPLLSLHILGAQIACGAGHIFSALIVPRGTGEGPFSPSELWEANPPRAGRRCCCVKAKTVGGKLIRPAQGSGKATKSDTLQTQGCLSLGTRVCVHSVPHLTGDPSRRPPSGEGSTTPGPRLRSGGRGGHRGSKFSPHSREFKECKTMLDPSPWGTQSEPAAFPPLGKQVGRNSRHPSGAS